MTARDTFLLLHAHMALQRLHTTPGDADGTCNEHAHTQAAGSMDRGIISRSSAHRAHLELGDSGDVLGFETEASSSSAGGLLQPPAAAVSATMDPSMPVGATAGWPSLLTCTQGRETCVFSRLDASMVAAWNRAGAQLCPGRRGGSRVSKQCMHALTWPSVQEAGPLNSHPASRQQNSQLHACQP